eukprot:COSAG02_NODE_49993_length_323_cov_0.924107_1_plen_57_part_01
MLSSRQAKKSPAISSHLRSTVFAFHLRSTVNAVSFFLFFISTVVSVIIEVELIGLSI